MSTAGTQLAIVLEGDGAFKEFAGRLERASLTHVTCLEGGMNTGRPAVGFLVQTEDGHALFCETSLRIFLTAADMFKAKYGDPRTEPEGPAA